MVTTIISLLNAPTYFLNMLVSSTWGKKHTQVLIIYIEELITAVGLACSLYCIY